MSGIFWSPSGYRFTSLSTWVRAFLGVSKTLAYESRPCTVIAILSRPIVWLISFEANFALVPWTCIWQGKLLLYLVSLAAFLISAGAGLLAWRLWGEFGREADPRGCDTLSRSRIMAFGGVMISSMCCLLIVAQATAESILGACQ